MEKKSLEDLLIENQESLEVSGSLLAPAAALDEASVCMPPVLSWHLTLHVLLFVF